MLAKIKKPDYAKDGIPRSEQVFIGRNKIAILSKKEQDAMRKVCRLTREVLDIAAREIKPGVTTDYIDEVLHKACMERDVRALIIHMLHIAHSLVISFTSQLLQFPKVRMHISKRSYLPWYSR